MAEVEIERLALEVPGLSPAEGHRLAELVARRLSEARWMPARGADRVDLTVAAPDDAGLERLAALVVDEMRRRMS